MTADSDETGMTGIDVKGCRRGCLLGFIYLVILITALIFTL